VQHLARNVRYSMVFISSSLLIITLYSSVIRTQNIQSVSWLHSRVRLYIVTHCFHWSGSWILTPTMNKESLGIGCWARYFNKGEDVAWRCKKNYTRSFTAAPFAKHWMAESRAERGSPHVREKNANEEFQGRHHWANLRVDGRSVLISVVVTNWC